jgi:predicted MFS family arabinose efflux permease
MAKSRAYLLVLLMGVACVHNADRMGFSIVLENIKRTLSLSDTQLGLLAGPIFALLSAASAIPLARLADRYGRKRILAACIMIWSGFTSVCGLAGGFAVLGTARACVGLADSAARPVSQAMVAAAFPPLQRTAALANLVSGSYFGTVLGFATAGVLAQSLGWRAALVGLGVPGVILGAVVWLTLDDPQEEQHDATPLGGYSWLMEWIRIVLQKDFVDATMAVASASILGWASIAWLPSFFQRSYGMKQAEIGFWLAGAMGIGAAVGAMAGGVAARRLNERSPRGGLWLAFWTTLASAPLLTAAFVTGSKAACLALIIASGVTGSVCIGPLYATVQGLADPRTRATVAAVFGITITLLGQAVGPLLVGVISDISARYYGRDSLRFSLELASLLGFWPAIHVYRLAHRPAQGLP